MNRLQRSIVLLGVTCATPSLLFVVAQAQDAPPAAPGQVFIVEKAVVVEKVDVKKGDEKKGDEKKAEVKEEAVEVRAVQPGIAFQVNANVNNLDPLIQQFTQQFRPVLRTELHFLKVVCSPTKDQQKKLAFEGYKALQTAVKKYAQNQQQMMNGQWRGGQQPDPRKLVQQGVLAAVKQHLSPEQAQRYLAEIERRNEDFKSVAIHNLVAKIDQELVLTSEQREQLATSLFKEWKDAWGGSLEMFMYGNEYLPVLPDKVITPLLNPIQKKVWNGAQKTQMNAFSGGSGFLGGVEMDPDPIDEDVFAELRKVEEAEAKAKAEAQAKIQGPPKPVNAANGAAPFQRVFIQPNPR